MPEAILLVGLEKLDVLGPDDTGDYGGDRSFGATFKGFLDTPTTCIRLGCLARQSYWR